MKLVCDYYLLCLLIFKLQFIVLLCDYYLSCFILEQSIETSGKVIIYVNNMNWWKFGGHQGFPGFVR